MAKIDIKHAFRLCPVHPDDWPLLGFKWLGNYFFDVCLPFGSRSSPFIFNTFADALAWILIHNLAFLVSGRSSPRHEPFPSSLFGDLHSFLPIWPSCFYIVLHPSQLQPLPTYRTFDMFFVVSLARRPVSYHTIKVYLHGVQYHSLLLGHPVPFVAMHHLYYVLRDSLSAGEFTFSTSLPTHYNSAFVLYLRVFGWFTFLLSRQSHVGGCAIWYTRVQIQQSYLRILFRSFLFYLNIFGFEFFGTFHIPSRLLSHTCLLYTSPSPRDS